MKKVFVSGCFDIIHGGHIEFFKQAKSFGDKLVVSFASEEILMSLKGKRSSLPEDHKKRILENIQFIDEVVVGRNSELDGLDFMDEFIRVKPDYLVVTEDDKFEEQKRHLCNQYGCEYVKLPKTLNYEKISTSDIIGFIRAPKEVPLRVDFAGGWLDVPKYSREGAFIVNCTIQPLVSTQSWDYEIGGGLGGSGAYAILCGKNPIQSELDMGVGWQDPAVIMETGLCAWRSGQKPVLEVKVNPDFLKDHMYLYWTGVNHNTPNLTNKERNYGKIEKAGVIAMNAVLRGDLKVLSAAVELSYEIQLEEGMQELPNMGELSKKYCGGGHGGYALYMFENPIEDERLIKIQPYMKWSE